MRRDKRPSRMSQRIEMLRELTTEWASIPWVGRAPPRAAEAVEALRQLEGGMRGFCADCGRKIPDAFLQADPQAAYCFRCQSERERLNAA